MKWQLKKVPIASLLNYEPNPRTLSKTQAKQLQASIERFGLIDKPVVNTDNTIIAGHQRLRILKKLGETEVECLFPEHPLTTDELQELNIRHNQNGGSWDWDMLANFDTSDLIQWGFDPSQFTDEPEPKAKKCWAKLEFDTQKDLSDCLEAIEEVSKLTGAKLKVKL